MDLTLNSAALPGPIRLPMGLTGEVSTSTRDLVSSSLFSAQCSGLSPEDFLRNCGDWGVDLSGYEDVSLRVSLFGPSESGGVFTIDAGLPGVDESPIALGEVRFWTE